MEEKKQIKISLGTTICICIIIVLILALGGMYYYFTNINNVNNMKKETIDINGTNNVVKESKIEQNEKKEINNVENNSNVIISENLYDNKEKNNSEKDNNVSKKFIGTWNTKSAYNYSVEEEISITDAIGSFWRETGSMLYLYEDGTFLDATHMVESGTSMKGTWKYSDEIVWKVLENEYKTYDGVILTYNDNRKESVRAWENEDGNIMLYYPLYETVELTLMK